MSDLEEPHEPALAVEVGVAGGGEPQAPQAREKIPHSPSEGLSYDPSDDKYWDERGLAREVARTFDICHECRMCFKYCDAFPSLFRALDERHDGDVQRLSLAETSGVMDACFQCKLCEVQCPYTPRDGHEYQVDFPKLVHRYKAVRAKAEGIRPADRVLGNPDLSARLARASLGLANVMNRVTVHRWFLEKALGVHRKKLLPVFAPRTFEHWARREGLIRREPGGEVVLFQTCYVQHNEPELGKDTVEVLRRNDVDVRCASHLVCCGMPAWESGNLGQLQRRARTNLRRLEPFVAKGAKVVAINPTCSMMLRREYPTLVAPEDRERAVKVAAAVRDPSEFLWSLREAGRFNDKLEQLPKRIAYHVPCHLRAQAVGFRGRDLLAKAGVEVTSVMECCGHDGTFAMRTAGFEPSQRVGAKAFAGMQSDAEAETWVTDCPLAALQFEQHAGKRPLHPMSVLARAYRAAPAEPPAGDAPPPPGE